MGPDFRSVEELQRSQLEMLAAGSLIPVNLESIAVGLENTRQQQHELGKVKSRFCGSEEILKRCSCC